MSVRKAKSRNDLQASYLRVLPMYYSNLLLEADETLFGQKKKKRMGAAHSFIIGQKHEKEPPKKQQRKIFLVVVNKDTHLFSYDIQYQGDCHKLQRAKKAKSPSKHKF